MKFRSKENLDVPIEDVFAMLADFDRHERSALRRGAEVKRLDKLGKAGIGAKWDILFELRGKKRKIDLEVSEFDAPNEMVLLAHMQGLESTVTVGLVALSKSRTRLNVVAELRPKTLSARLLVQSLKLAKGNIARRFDKRLASFARDMEDAHLQRRKA